MKQASAGNTGIASVARASCPFLLWLPALFLLSWGHSIGDYRLLRDDFVAAGMRGGSFLDTIRFNWELNGIWRLAGYSIQAHALTSHPGFFHALGVLLGALMTALLFLLIRGLLGSPWLAALGAGAWAILPAHHEMFLFIDRMHYLMALACWLAAALCQLPLLDSVQGRARYGLYAVGSFLFSLLSCLMLESVLPLVVALPLLALPRSRAELRALLGSPARLAAHAAPAVAVGIYLLLYVLHRPETAYQEPGAFAPRIILAYHYFALDAVAVGLEPLLKPHIWWLMGHGLAGPGIVFPLVALMLMIAATVGACRLPVEGRPETGPHPRPLPTLIYAVTAAALAGALFSIAGLRAGARIYLGVYPVYLLGGVAIVQLLAGGCPPRKWWIALPVGAIALLLTASNWFTVGHWKFASARTYSLTNFVVENPPEAPFRPVYLLDFRRELPRQSFRWSPVDEAWGVRLLAGHIAGQRGEALPHPIETTSDYSWDPVVGEVIIQNGPSHFDWSYTLSRNGGGVDTPPRPASGLPQ